MFNLPSTLLLASLLLTSCVDGDDMDAQDSSPSSDSAIAACDCSDLNIAAADVSFDNADSGLVADSVQDAIAEVSAVALADVADRVFAVDNSTTDAADISFGVGAVCGGGQGTALALGGGCDINNNNATLVKAELRESSYVCEWRKPSGQSATGTARVTCLSLNP